MHTVFSAKDRRPLVVPAMKERLYAYIGGIARECKSTLVSANGPSDHVHLLLQMSPAISVSDLMRLIKTNSSKWVHETFRHMPSFGWQIGYGAFSVSYSNIEAVKKYIENQEEHHKKMDFKTEFRELLKKHAVTFDEAWFLE